MRDHRITRLLQQGDIDIPRIILRRSLCVGRENQGFGTLFTLAREVIGTLLAEELTKGGFLSLNAHKTIYIIKPEFNSNSQIMFKDNFRPMLNGKNVILLTATVTTGLTINKGIEGIQYYGGIIQSVSAVFSALDEMNGIPIKSVFGKRELPDYMFSDYRNCPICKEGKKLDALINPYGYSKL